MTYKEIIFKLSETPDEELKNMTEEERLALIFKHPGKANETEKNLLMNL